MSLRSFQLGQKTVLHCTHSITDHEYDQIKFKIRSHQFLPLASQKAGRAARYWFTMSHVRTEEPFPAAKLIQAANGPLGSAKFKAKEARYDIFAQREYRGRMLQMYVLASSF